MICTHLAHIDFYTDYNIRNSYITWTLRYSKSSEKAQNFLKHHEELFGNSEGKRYLVSVLKSLHHCAANTSRPQTVFYHH